MDVARGIISSLFIVLNTLVCSSAIIILSVLRWLIPNLAGKLYLGNLVNSFNNLWVYANEFVLLRCLRISQVSETWSTLEQLSKYHWYLIICNHQSWADILILQIVLMHHIPTVKFFTKRQLLWFPFIGTAMWFLDYPYVYRFSREQLQRDPSLRGKDRLSIRQACWKFKQRPTSILNFLEGTRYTDAKHAYQNSPYRHLLLPKSGGIRTVCAELGDQIDRLLDVTIVYPDGAPSFWSFLCGRTKRLIVDVQVKRVPQACLTAELNRDSETSNDFKLWVDELWQQKDSTIDHFLNVSREP